VSHILQVADHLHAHGKLPKDVAKATAALEAAPESRKVLIAAAMYIVWPALNNRPNYPVKEVLAFSQLMPFPHATPEINARVILGESPAQIFKGLTAKEAHQAIADGAVNASDWLMRHVGDASDFCDLPVAVARWLLACIKDKSRLAALEKSQVHRGPQGEEIAGRLLDRVDEIKTVDLVEGEKTGVRVAFERAAARAYKRWEKEAATQHEPLAPLPKWLTPVRCARPLMSAAELATEGRAMKHCVGTYSVYVKRQTSVIVSIAVKTPMGLHRSTAEIDRQTRAIKQHKGPGNETPHPLCQKALKVCAKHWEGNEGLHWLEMLAKRMKDTMNWNTNSDTSAINTASEAT